MSKNLLLGYFMERRFLAVGYQGTPVA